MNIIKKYIKAYILIIHRFYCFILLKTDKKIFSFLFNLRSVLIRSRARLKWQDDTFVVTDKLLPQFRHLVRHRHRCDMCYRYGIVARADSLAESYFLKQINFKKGDIFLDCGANVGDLKLWFSLYNIDVTYIAFEPSPIEFNCLKRNIKPSIAHNIGLWNEEGEIKFFISSERADSSLIEPKYYDEVITSKVMRLENFVDKRIKCLNLEAEGAELEVLEGLGERLSLVEFISADLGYERGVNEESTLVPVTNFLLFRDFELVDISHKRICALYRNKKYLTSL